MKTNNEAGENDLQGFPAKSYLFVKLTVVGPALALGGVSSSEHTSVRTDEMQSGTCSVDASKW